MTPAELRKWLAFGTGVGIEIRDDDLEVTVARVRPYGVDILGATTIERFRQRPAAEWGAEYGSFLRRCGGSHLTATVLLPRREMVVRHLSLPGVAIRDLDAAIRFQIDSLHPYPEDEAAFGWTRLPGTPVVLIGIARVQVVEQYVLLFAEAGIRVASFSFSAAAAYSAIHLLGPVPGEGFLVLEEREGGLEAYGESPARPVFSAVFDLPSERAAALAAAELRLEADVEPVRLHQLLPACRTAPEEFDPSRAPLAYATALAGACPRLSLRANLLPVGQRSASSHLVFLPTVVLSILLLIAAGLYAAHGTIADRRYLAVLESEIARLTPQATKLSDLDRSLDAMRARRLVLQEFRNRSKTDLDVLQELTRILEPPAWLNSLQITRANVVVVGEAEQAAALLKIIDNSPLLRASQFTLPMARVGSAETFAIRAERESTGGDQGQ